MIRQHDLAQPFRVELHPVACDCPACDDATFEPSLARSVRDYTLLGLIGIIIGQLIGWALDAVGILALLGIG